MTDDEAADLAIQLAAWAGHQPPVDDWMHAIAPLDHAIALRAYTRLCERYDAVQRTPIVFRAEYETCLRRAAPIDPTDRRFLTDAERERGLQHVAAIRAQIAARHGRGLS